MLHIMKKVLESTKDLRAENGKLSAKLVGELYDVPGGACTLARRAETNGP